MEKTKLSEKDIEKKIYTIFSDVASSLGYSPLHGQIIGVLLVKDRPVSLDELTKETGYSSSMISLSLDLLEVLNVIKRVKKTGDRKLYIQLKGNLLEILRSALLVKLKKSITGSLQEFDEAKKGLPKESQTVKTIEILETEIKKLGQYVDLLSKVGVG